MRAKPHAPRPSGATSPLHRRNRHQGRYDFAALIALCPSLARFVSRNTYGDDTINFADPAAVKALNSALLRQHYGIRDWDIPHGYLCPPIPGRADYLHNLADLLAQSNQRHVPRGDTIQVLDIGVGANCVYPLIGHAEYGWRFVGSDVDPAALRNGQAILDANPDIAPFVTLRRQPHTQAIFSGIIMETDRFDLTLCNPPFHRSKSEAEASSQRKWQNLGKTMAVTRNFGGHAAELWCAGGEEAFVRRMIEESVTYANRCLWFSSLIAKTTTLPAIYRSLKQAGVVRHETITMAQGQKQSRIIAWTFMDEQQQQDWCAQRA
jgi:23S rRNA (adenine1618-N6)-methyltransferase